MYYSDRNCPPAGQEPTEKDVYIGGGVLKLFLTGCAAKGLKSLPISKDFSAQKNKQTNKQTNKHKQNKTKI